MEQRLHAREPAKFTVRLVQQGRIVATAETIDMSMYGIGIEPPNVALNSGEIVDVDLVKAGHPRGISCCFPSLVIHAGPKSVGLMLAYDSEFRQLLPEQHLK